MIDLSSRLADSQAYRRRTWKSATATIVVLATIICANEAQRIAAQWQSHKERQAQLYQAQANGMKLDKVIEQNDLQIQLLMQHSTDLERIKVAAKEQDILRKTHR